MKRWAFLLITVLFYTSAQAGLVAWYEFEGNANDSIGSNHGTMIDGASIVTDPQRGQVLSLDGENDYVSLSMPVITTTEFTLISWANHYYPGSPPYNANNVFQQRTDEVGDNRSGVNLITEYDGLVYSSIRSSNGSVQQLTYPIEQYGEWHHYAVTVSSDYITLYIDGIEVDIEENLQLGEYDVDIDYVDIGRRRYEGLDRGFFDGYIDDMRFYDYALSEDEIREIIPEPCTLMMLSFGSVVVFLKRRKK